MSACQAERSFCFALYIHGGAKITGTVRKRAEKKEEPEMAAPENKITTVDALKAAYPDLVATIQNDAAAAERARIKSIEDLTNGNYAALAADAKFTNPTSAQELAVKIIAEQNKAGGTYIENRQKDAQDSGANGVLGAVPEDGAGDNGKNVFEAAIDKLFPEVK